MKKYVYRAHAGAVASVRFPTDIAKTRQLLRRMLHTVDEVDQVIFANREKLKIDKGAQDFSGASLRCPAWATRTLRLRVHLLCPDFHLAPAE